MFTRTRFLLAVLLASLLSPATCLAQTRGSVNAAGNQVLAWFDTLGLPDVSGKPFVRVDTGRWIERSGSPRRNLSVEGFLLGEADDSFDVFISGVREFHPPNSASYIPALLGEIDIRFAPMRTVRFNRVFDNDGETGRASYQVMDLRVHAAALIERVRQQAQLDDYLHDLLSPFGYPAPGAQVVAFAHALRQSGRERQGDELLRLFIRACLADRTPAWWDNPLARLQDTLGRTFVEWAETDMADGIVPRTELIDVYATFGSLFPPGDTGINSQRDYMQRSAAVLERMAIEEAAHVARPLASLAPAAQAAELIYQLRDQHLPPYPAINLPNPIEPTRPQEDNEKTPVQRLVDLGDAAVPALIEALGDDSFTRTVNAGMKAHPTRAKRVNDFALGILEHMAGQRFPREPEGGPWVIARSRPYVEQWWAQRQGGQD